VSPSSRRFLVIRNPTAGRRHPRVFDDVLARIRGRDLMADVIDTEARGDALRLARDADARCYDAVVAAGGDGTVNEIVNGLMARPTDDLALGIIALGTANVLAREIGVGAQADGLAAALIDGAIVPIMVGKLTDAHKAESYFQLMVGAGFDAHVVAGVDPAMKRRLGKGAYVWRTLVEMLGYRDRRYRVVFDGKLSCDVASAIVSNGHFYGGPYVLAPRADLRRPVLSVCLFERGGRLQVMRYGLALMRGRLPTASGFRIVEATSVRIMAAGATAAASGTEPVQVDGDHTMSLPIVVSVAPRRLGLLMPPADRQGAAARSRVSVSRLG
jgi:YegS/Rv2252/BmrU family lipid kinase